MLDNIGTAKIGGAPPGALHRRLPAALLAGVLSAWIQPLLAQPAGVPPPNPQNVNAAGVGMRLSDHPKLLAPLPPPPAGSEAPSPDPRNLQGVYIVEAGPGGAGNPFGGPPPPYTPKGQQIKQHQMDMMAKGTPLGGTSARCRPMEAIGIGADLFPAEIVQSKDKVVVLIEEGRGRWVIRLDRDHPKQLTPSYWGDSVGHWDGNTLVVDTIGFNGKHDFQSTKSHVVSRLRKLGDGHTIELQTTTEDPEFYTRPVVQKKVGTWHPELSLLEFQCEENLEGAREGLIVE